MKPWRKRTFKLITVNMIDCMHIVTAAAADQIWDLTMKELISKVICYDNLKETS